MKITKRQLRRIIKEGIDIVNHATGELLVFEDDWETAGGDAPEAAARDIMKRLRITQLGSEIDGDIESIEIAPADWALMDVELGGKRDHRRRKKMEHGYKKERERLNIDNLKDRLSQWGQDAGDDWKSDHESGNLPGYPDLAGAAMDLARNAKYEFAEDEWDELVWEFEDEDAVYEFAMGSMG
jgi:hypothetical protein